MSRAATIIDIAKDAGVGKSTVYRVIHNNGYVSEEKRARIEESIRRLQYEPNLAARMLAKSRSRRIAVIFQNAEKSFWDEVEQGINEAADEFSVMGVSVEKFVLPHFDAEEMARVIRECTDQGFSGIAVVPAASDVVKDAIAYASDHGVKVIIFNNREQCKAVCYVGDDTLQSGRTAGKLMSMMARRNARYVIVLPVGLQLFEVNERFSGFCEVIKSRRPDMQLVSVIDANMDYSIGYTKMRDLLKKEKIDAVYAVNIIIEQAAKAVEEAGLQDEIRMIGHDLTPEIREYLRRGVIDISIGQEARRQGYLAVERLCRLLLADQEITGDIFTRIEIVISENEKSILS